LYKIKRGEKMKKFLSVLLIFTIVCIAPAAYAQDAGTKLLRGAVNALTGSLELPFTVFKVSKNEGYPRGLTYGLGKGLVNGLHRTIVGIYEVVTFPIPIPADYESILAPETLFDVLESANPSMRKDFTPLKEELKRPVK